MTRNEFEEFYDYITRLEHGTTYRATKEFVWQTLKDLPIEKVMMRAKDVYKYLEHSPSLINPKVFRGELPNPGLYRNFNNCDLPC